MRCGLLYDYVPVCGIENVCRSCCRKDWIVYGIQDAIILINLQLVVARFSVGLFK